MKMEGMEQHRVLIVILSLTLFVALVLGAGLWLFYPRADRGEATIADAAPLEEGRSFDPIEYLRGDEEEPVGIEPEEESEDDDVIIVYGEPEEPDDEDLTKDGTADRIADRGSDEPDAADRRSPVVTEPGIAPADDDEAADRSETTAAAPRDEATQRTDTAPTVAAPREDARRDSSVGAKAHRKDAAPVPPADRLREPHLVTREEYWIQLISSPSLDTVERARRRLNEWTISGLITSITRDETTYYRLRVGPWIEKAEAEKFLDWIQRIEGFGTSYISLVYNERLVAN